MFISLEKVAVAPVAAVDVVVDPDVVVVAGDPVAIVGAENCWVVIPPTVLAKPKLKKLMPRDSLLVRSTLAKRTLSMICFSAGGTSTYRRLMTLPWLPPP